MVVYVVVLAGRTVVSVDASVTKEVAVVVGVVVCLTIWVLVTVVVVGARVLVCVTVGR